MRKLSQITEDIAACETCNFNPNVYATGSRDSEACAHQNELYEYRQTMICRLSFRNVVALNSILEVSANEAEQLIKSRSTRLHFGEVTHNLTHIDGLEIVRVGTYFEIKETS